MHQDGTKHFEATFLCWELDIGKLTIACTEGHIANTAIRCSVPPKQTVVSFPDQPKRILVMKELQPEQGRAIQVVFGTNQFWAFSALGMQERANLASLAPVPPSDIPFSWQGPVEWQEGACFGETTLAEWANHKIKGNQEWTGDAILVVMEAQALEVPTNACIEDALSACLSSRAELKE